MPDASSSGYPEFIVEFDGSIKDSGSFEVAVPEIELCSHARAFADDEMIVGYIEDIQPQVTQLSDNSILIVCQAQPEVDWTESDYMNPMIDITFEDRDISAQGSYDYLMTKGISVTCDLPDLSEITIDTIWAPKVWIRPDVVDTIGRASDIEVEIEVAATEQGGTAYVYGLNIVEDANGLYYVTTDTLDIDNMDVHGQITEVNLVASVRTHDYKTYTDSCTII